MLGCSGPWLPLQCFYTTNPTQVSKRGHWPRRRAGWRPGERLRIMFRARTRNPAGLSWLYYLPNADFAHSFSLYFNMLQRAWTAKSESSSHIEKCCTLGRLLGSSAYAENLDIELCYRATTTNPMDTVVRNIHPGNQETVVIQI